MCVCVCLCMRMLCLSACYVHVCMCILYSIPSLVAPFLLIDTMVICVIYALHRHPEVWDNPEVSPGCVQR